MDQVVWDRLEPCVYLPGQAARQPLRWPREPIDPAAMQRRLEQGQRRAGLFWYQPQCPQCSACQSLRLPVQRFQPSRTQRRVLRRGVRLLGHEIVPPAVDDRRLQLFNRHRAARRLGIDGQPVDAQSYAYMFVQTQTPTFEMAFTLEGRLAAVAICDQGANCLSAVYTYFDPALSPLSLGTYAILRQIEYCRRRRFDYLYLGYYAAGSRLAYKAQFRPHERFVAGRWQCMHS